MALFKSEQQRELETLENIEASIRRRERIHHILIAGLGILLAVSCCCHLLCRKKK